MRNYRLLGLAVVAAVALSACQQSKSLNNLPMPLPCVGSGCGSTSGNPVPGPTPFATGDTVPLNIVSNSVLTDYSGGIPLNSPQNPQINLAVVANSSQVFLGEVNIRYTDTQTYGVVLHSAHLTNGDDSTHGNNVHVLTTSTSGVPTYRFFFEDAIGAVIVTLTGSTNPSDTGGVGMSGKVYYRNFNSSAPNPLFNGYYAPTSWCAVGYNGCVFSGGFFYEFMPSNPNAFCWSGQITTGPYDCRNMVVEPTTNSGKAFTLLGTFTGLNRAKALGF